ncbi:protein FAM228A [Notolabrus celidotus]|uniref:protein FAM228A n=1 Tax=Notolabrus celidotus TaxID=1203425 RepID=UPI00149055F9|nr:protein FAM228A [Notolabrus celidotus]XP_034555108.1 protein FAM228A [Notolabrus celidotus]
MRPKKKSTANGVITFHTPLPVSLLKPEECTAELKSPTESKKSPSQPRSPIERIKARKNDDTSPSEPQLSSRQNLLSHTSLRQLQVKMEAENQQAENIIKPLLETEKGFIKELERFFSQRDVTELRRRELLHKRWTERVWFPLQRRVEERASDCGPVEAKRRQSLFSHYLHHCNTKGFVFLETYDLKEYNPFLLNITQKLSTADFKDPFYLQLHERLKDQRTARCEAGCKHKLPQSTRPLGRSGASQADTPEQAASFYHSSASRKTTAESVTQGRKSSKLETVPYHISASATPDGRCSRLDCSFSRCGDLQQLYPTYE